MHTVLFYRTGSGRAVVQEWLRSFDKPDRVILGADLLAVQMTFPVGAPLCGSLGNGIYEVRTSLAGNREARMLFFQDTKSDALVVVHAFLKKSRKITKSDLHLALKRKREFSP